MSRNSKANRKRRAAKDSRHAKRRRSGARAQAGWDSPADFFGWDERLTVSMIRSASGQQYAEDESIPFPDREVVAVVEDVLPSDADRVASELRAKIDTGEYPADARVSIMGGWSSFGL